MVLPMNPLRRLRLSASLTQFELAKAVDIDPGQIGRYERADKLTCSLQTAGILARALGCSVDDLLPEPQPAPQGDQ